jgi:hypothetical protein
MWESSVYRSIFAEGETKGRDRRNHKTAISKVYPLPKVASMVWSQGPNRSINWEYRQ